MIKVAILDDEPIAIDILKGYFHEIEDFEVVATFSNPVKALPFLSENRIDVLFLDIQMPKMSGLDMLRSMQNQPMVVFTTAYPEYALESFDFVTVDYLTKPISYARFIKSIQKLRSLNKDNKSSNNVNQKDASLLISIGKTLRRIPKDHILYIKSDGDYVHIHLENERIVYHATLKSLIEELGTDDFIRVHHSYIVSRKKVSILDGNRLLIGKTHIPVSRSHKKEVIEAFKS